MVIFHSYVNVYQRVSRLATSPFHTANSRHFAQDPEVLEDGRMRCVYCGRFFSDERIEKHQAMGRMGMGWGDWNRDLLVHWWGIPKNYGIFMGISGISLDVNGWWILPWDFSWYFLNPWDDVYRMIPRHWKNVNGKNHPQMANDSENKGGLYYQLNCIRRAIFSQAIWKFVNYYDSARLFIIVSTTNLMFRFREIMANPQLWRRKICVYNYHWYNSYWLGNH